MKPPHLTPSIAVGDLVFTSGQLGRDEKGQIRGDISQQTRQALDNLECVLADHELQLSDVVKTTAWLRSQTDLSNFNDVFATVFGTHRPCRSTVVSALARPEALVEIEAIACKRPR